MAMMSASALSRSRISHLDRSGRANRPESDFAIQSIPDRKVDASGMALVKCLAGRPQPPANLQLPLTERMGYDETITLVLGAFMFRKLFVACVLQAVMQALIASSAGAAGPYGSIKIGAWIGGAFTDDSTGAFSHCAAT